MIIGKTFAVDDVGNIIFDKDGNIKMVEGEECFGQLCKIHLLTQQGEDPNAPWMGNPLTKLISLSQDVASDEFVEMSSRIALNPANIRELKKVENVELQRVDRQGYLYVKVVSENGATTDLRIRFGGYV